MGDTPSVQRTPDADGDHRMPEWVKRFVIAAVSAVVLVTLVLLVGNGSHGPSRHLPGGDSGSEAPHSPPVDHG